MAGASGNTHKLISLHAVREATKLPNVGRIFAILFIYTTAFSMIEQVLSLFIERIWLVAEMAAGTSAKPAALLTGYTLMIVGITATIVQGGLIGRLTARFGEKRLLATGIALVAVSLLDVVLAGHLGRFQILLLNAVVMATGTGLVSPSSMGLLSRSVPPDRQGSVLGLGQSFSALGRVVGPAVSGMIFSRSIDLPFYFGAALLALGCGVALTLTNTDTSRPVPSPLPT